MGKAATVELAAKRQAAAVSRTFASFLFASGASALIFQILWIKQLSVVVGIDVYAVTTAVSAFFCGTRRWQCVVRPEG